MPSFYDQAGVQWLQNIKGLDDNVQPGSQHQVAVGVPQTISPHTNDLSNVRVRFGLVQGRGGMTSFQGAGASSTSPIIGLFNYRRAGSGNPNLLMRLTPSKLEQLIAGVWTDKTGSTLSGTSTTRPQFTIQNDILVYTMEGLSLPQGFGTNSGVGVNFTTGTTLPGSPPFCKTLCSYFNFLMLGNVSNNGTFTDVFDGWRSIIYSPTPFTTWSTCGDNTIDLYQTSGDLVNMQVLGRILMCYKTDGIVKVSFVGGATRFTQELMVGARGCAAPLSVVDLGAHGHAYLATDGVIYNVTATDVEAVSFDKLSRTLTPLVSTNRFKWARGMHIATQDLYVLFYDRSSNSGQFLDSYATWNYRTGEFTRGTLGQLVIAPCSFRIDPETVEVPLVSTNTLVEEFDSSNNTQTDDGTTIKRYWTSGWQKLAQEEGYLYGVVAVMRKSTRARLKISLARNMFDSFEREMVFSLKGNDPSASFVECDYRFPAPVLGSWFNVKLEFLHDSPTAVSELLRIGFITEPKHKVPGVPNQMPQNEPNQGSGGGRQ